MSLAEVLKNAQAVFGSGRIYFGSAAPAHPLPGDRWVDLTSSPTKE
jgi:hypothetical protein